MPRLVKRTEEILDMNDLDHAESIQLKKTRELWEGDDEELFERNTVSGLITGEGTITNSKDIRTVCSNWRCRTRLSAQTFRECSRCDRPLCRKHTHKFRDQNYCRRCSRVMRLRAVVSWLCSPVGSED